MGDLIKYLQEKGIDPKSVIDTNPNPSLPAYNAVGDFGNKDIDFDADSNFSPLYSERDRLRAEHQSSSSKMFNTLGQGVGTFGTAMASTIAALGSGTVALGAETADAFIEGDQYSGLDIALNNPVMKGISDFDKFLKEEFIPTYYSPEQQETLLSAATGTDFINGLGFLASNLVPNSLITKVFGNLAKAVTASRLGQLESKLLQASKTGLLLEEEIPKVSAFIKGIEKTGEVTASAVSRLGESAIEANDVYEQLINNGADEETAKRLRNNVFIGNMLLAASDFLQATRWFNRGGIADDIVKQGMKYAPVKKTIKDKVGSAVGEALQEAGEEGYQYVLQQAAKKGANGSDWFSDVFNSVSDAFTTIEGQKSMLLGAVLGGGVGSLVKAANSKTKSQIINAAVQEANANPSIRDRYIINAEGKRVINPEFENTAIQFAQFEKLKQEALQENDATSYNLYEQLQFSQLVASRKRMGKFDEFVDELSALGKTSPEEMKAMFGELPLDANGNEKLPSQIASEKIAEAKRLSKLIDSIDAIPQFKNLIPEAKNHIARIAITQDGLQKNLQEIDSAILESQAKGGPLAEEIVKDLTQKREAVAEKIDILNNQLKAYVAKPEKVVKNVEKVEEVKQTVAEENIKTAEKKEAQAQEKQSKAVIDPDNNQILTPDGKLWNIVVNNETGEVSYVDAEGNTTKEIFKSNPDAKIVNKKQEVISDFDNPKETTDKTTIEDEDKYFRKTSALTTAGRNSTPKGEYNSDGDRRNENLPAGRKLYYETLDRIASSAQNVSLKLEVAPESMYDELFEGKTPTNKEPIIIGYLYINGKPVEKDGVRAYTTIHESGYTNFAPQASQGENSIAKLKGLREKVINATTDIYVPVLSISPGFVNTKIGVYDPLSTVVGLPEINKGGVTFLPSFLNEDTGSAYIEDNNTRIGVKYSGRAYLRINAGIDSKGRPVYKYHELKSRLLTNEEVDHTILPLIKMYLQGERKVTINGIETNILSYDSRIASVLDTFLYFGSNSTKEKSIFFGEGANKNTLYYGWNGVSKIPVTIDNFDSMEKDLRAFLLNKHKILNKKYTANLLSKLTIPKFRNGKAENVSLSYYDLLINDFPGMPAAFKHNIAKKDGTIFLNRYLTFSDEVSTTPITKVKTSTVNVSRPQGPQVPVTKKEPINGPVTGLQYFMMSANEREEYDKLGLQSLEVPDKLKHVFKAYIPYFFQEQAKNAGDPNSTTSVQVLNPVDFTKQRFPESLNDLLEHLSGEPTMAQPVKQPRFPKPVAPVVEPVVEKPKDETSKEDESPFTEDIESKKADIEKRRQEELKPYDERDKKSINQIDPSNKNPLINVGDKFDSGLRVIVENSKTDDNYSKEKADNNGDGVEVITKVISPAEVDKNGKMTKAAKVEVTIFNNMKEATEAINKQLEKVKNLVGKKQKEINAKYDAELSSLETKTEPKKEESSEFNVTDDEDPFARISTKLPYKRGDIDSAVKWVQAKLGVTPEVAKGLIRASAFEEGLFGMFHKGVLTLSDILEEGTEYHEAFHFVSQMYLTKAERDSLYKQVRAEKESNLSDRECEEILAESFRDYVMSDGKIKFPEVKRNIFQKLLDLIKSWLGFNTVNINDVYSKINAGYYNKQRYIESIVKDGDSFARKIEISPTEEFKIEAALLAYFRHFMFNSKVKFSDFDIESNIPAFNEFAKERFAKYNSAFNIDPDYFLDKFKKITLSSLEIDIEEDGDKISRNTGNEYAESHKISAFNGISPKINLLFNTIVDDTQPVNEYGHKPLIPASEVKAYLANILHDTFSLKEMYSKMSNIIQEAKNSTNTFDIRNASMLKQIGNSLGKMTDDAPTVMLHTEFFDAVSLVYQTMITQLHYVNGDVSLLDSMKETAKNKVQETINLSILKQDFVKNQDGQRYITNEDFNRITSLPAKDFLKAIGVELLSEPSDVTIDIWKNAIRNLPKKNIIVDGKTISVSTPFWIKLEEAVEEASKNNREIKKRISEWRKGLKFILDNEVDYYNLTVENQSRNTEGETVYAFAKPSFLFQKVAAIKQGLAKNVSAKDSKLWDAIVDNKVEIVLNDGQRFVETGVDGQHVSTLTEEELLLNRIHNLYKSRDFAIVSFLQMADKKSMYAMKITDKSLITYPDQVQVDISNKKINVDDSYIDRLYQIYQNYKEFDELEEIKKFKTHSKAVSVFENLGNVSTKEQFKSVIESFLYENYVELIPMTQNFTGRKSKNDGSIVNFSAIDSQISVNLEKTLAGLVATELVTNLEQMNIFFGNPAFYKDLFKRTPAIRANGRVPNVDSHVNTFIVESRKEAYGTYQNNLPSDSSLYKGMVFNDIEVASNYSKEYKEEFNISNYDEVNATDAQGLSTFQFYREYMIRTGQWSKEQEEGFWLEMAGKKSNVGFPPLKLVHFGAEQSVTNEFVPVYYKFAVYPLIPSMIRGRNLENVNQKLLLNGSSIGVFNSGNKVGNIADVKKSNFYDTNISDDFTHLLNIQDLKIQVDIAAKEDKWEQLFGTQIRKLITQNIADAGENFKDREDYDKFVELVDKLVLLEADKLADELKTPLKELRLGKISPQAWSKLIDIFKQSAKDRQESDNIILGLDYLKKEGVTIDVLPTRDKIQNLMNALINNRIQKQKMFGRPYIQCSSVGFEYKDEVDKDIAVEKGELLKDSEFYRTGRLGFIHKKDGKVVEAEILLPYWFKEKFKNINDIDPKLLEVLAYRIPTQGLNSMLTFKVVGFLPKSADQLAAVPYEITMQAGSDFDVDKLNTFLYNYSLDENKDPGFGNLSEKEKLQNQLLDLMHKRLKDTDRFKDYITPNSADELKNIAHEINNIHDAKYKIQVDYKGMKQFATGTNIKIGRTFWSAKAGVGQAASQGTFTSLTQVSPLFQKANVMFNGNIEGESIIFGKIYNKSGESIMDIIANQHLTANVDAAKDPFIFMLNANAYTNDVHYYLTAAGVDKKWIGYFMNQPIILDYVKAMMNNRGIVAKKRQVILGERKSKEDIIKDLRKIYGGESIPSAYLNGKYDTKNRNIPTIEDFKKGIKNPGKEQLDFLEDFLWYYDYATDRRTLISSVKFDTQGAGKNLPESQIFRFKFTKALATETYGGLTSLIENTILKTFKENVLDLALGMYDNTIIINRLPNMRITLETAMQLLNEAKKLTPENMFKVHGMLTNIVLQNNIPNVIQWLDKNVFSENSVAKQISKLIGSEEMKDNYLFSNILMVDFAQKNNEFDVVKFDNSVRIDRELESVINEGFRDFKSKYPALYNDLIKLSLFQTGVIQSPISFYRYIPVEDFFEVTKDLIKDPQISETKAMELLTQNLPQLPGLAPKVSRADISNWSSGLPDSIHIKENSRYADFQYVTKTSGNQIALYKRTLSVTDSQDIVFEKIDIKSNYKFYLGVASQNKMEFDETQVNPETIDIEAEEIRPEVKYISKVKKVISGGQTGGDMGGLKGARKAGIETGGTAPPNFLQDKKGNQKELLTSYGLIEGEYDPYTYPKRTMKNVDDSDGTVAILWGPSAGTEKTIGYAQTRKWQSAKESKFDGYKPVLVIKTKNLEEAKTQLSRFLDFYKIQTLNVAGHRESSQPGLEDFTEKLIYEVLKNQNTSEVKYIAVRKDPSLPKVQEFKGFWTRDLVAKQEDKVFLFGDNTNDRLNTKYVPSSTQAVIRGLPNAIGIDTKKDRGSNISSYFSNSDFLQFKQQVDEAIQKAKNSGKTIVIPADGIGTGKAMLKEKAPVLFNYLQQELEKLKNNVFTVSWESLSSETLRKLKSQGFTEELWNLHTEEEKQNIIKCHG